MMASRREMKFFVSLSSFEVVLFWMDSRIAFSRI